MSPREFPGQRVRVTPERLAADVLDDLAREIERGARVLRRQLPTSARVLGQLRAEDVYDEKVVGGWTCMAERAARGPWHALHVLDVARIQAALRCASGIEFTDVRWAAGFVSEALRRLCRGVPAGADGAWRACVGFAADAIHATARQEPAPLRGERALSARLIGYCDDENEVIRAVSEVARVALSGCGRLDAAYTRERDAAHLLDAWRVVEPAIRMVNRGARAYAEAYGRWLYRDATHAGRSAAARREFGRVVADAILERAPEALSRPSARVEPPTIPLQNIPIRSELGDAIRGGLTQPGVHRLSAIDFKQLELLHAARLAKAGGEDQLAEALRRAAQEVSKK